MMQPTLRFQQFQDKWKVEKLNDLGEFKRSYSFSRSYEGNGDYKHLHYGDIHSKFWGILDNNTPFPSITASEDFEVINNQDLIFADASEDYKDLGKAAVFWNFTFKNVVAGLHTHLFRSSEEVDSRFLMYFTQTNKYYTYIRRVGTGVSVLGLSKTNLGLLEIDIPKYEEQQKIADFFTLLDRRIEKQQKKVEAWREYKKGMMQKLFSRELRFKDEDGQEFPEWEVTQLKKIVSTFSGGTPSSKQRSFYTGDIPFIRSGEISQSSTELFINSEGLESSSAKLVQKGDLLYALYGATSGEVAISKMDGAINQAILCIRTEESKYFLLHYLTLMKESILSTYLQGGQGNLSAQIIKEITISLPSKEEQEKIAEFLSALDIKVENEVEKLRCLEEQKNGFMQQMFV